MPSSPRSLPNRSPLSRAGGLMLALLTFSAATVHAAEGDEDDGFKPIFDGQSLDGWKGDPALWRVEDGAIVGRTTAEAPIPANTFLYWEDGEVDDFELELEYKIEGGNSGIQVRSFLLDGDPPFRIGGYQADIDSGERYSGIVYGEQFRGILADRGQRTVIEEDGKPRVVETFGDAAKLNEHVRKGEWNRYRIEARGFTIRNLINGQLMAEVTDEDTDVRRRKGLLAFQLHAGPPMKVSFRNIRLKRLPLEDVKKVVFVAGQKSHGWGAHEHNAGSLLLADRLGREAADRAITTVYRSGWPRDPSAFDNANAVVMYCDGGGGHMAKWHLRQLEELSRKGVGIGCIHYAVEIPKDEGGEQFLDWLGGYFETHWSVNPHWTAEFAELPEHPVTRGVEPFSIRDEWYYHMRFRDGMEGVTPLLSALPPEETLRRPDGPHSGNPDVRAAIERGETQHVAWVSEQPDRGRGFGFTGGHFHDNWAHDEFRQLVLNAALWIAGAEVPEGGVTSETPDRAELDANQDYDKPENR